MEGASLDGENLECCVEYGIHVPSDLENSTPLNVVDMPMNRVASPMPKIPRRTMGLRPMTSASGNRILG